MITCSWCSWWSWWWRFSDDERPGSDGHCLLARIQLFVHLEVSDLGIIIVISIFHLKVSSVVIIIVISFVYHQWWFTITIIINIIIVIITITSKQPSSQSKTEWELFEWDGSVCRLLNNPLTLEMMITMMVMMVMARRVIVFMLWS